MSQDGKSRSAGMFDFDLPERCISVQVLSELKYCIPQAANGVQRARNKKLNNMTGSDEVESAPKSSESTLDGNSSNVFQVVTKNLSS